MTENFPKINVRHQTPVSESTENINRINAKRNDTQHIIFKLQKIKENKNPDSRHRKKQKPLMFTK